MLKSQSKYEVLLHIWNRGNYTVSLSNNTVLENFTIRIVKNEQIIGSMVEFDLDSGYRVFDKMAEKVARWDKMDKDAEIKSRKAKVDRISYKGLTSSQKEQIKPTVAKLKADNRKLLKIIEADITECDIYKIEHHNAVKQLQDNNHELHAIKYNIASLKELNKTAQWLHEVGKYTVDVDFKGGVYKIRILSEDTHYSYMYEFDIDNAYKTFEKFMAKADLMHEEDLKRA